MAHKQIHSKPQPRPAAKSLAEYGRGFAGGLLFSLPLLYTMEMWYYGFIASSGRLLAAMAATFILLLGYNRYAGMRRDATWAEVVIDSVEELGLGILLSAAVLAILGRIGPDISLHEVAGKVLVEGMAAAIGFSVGTAQLGGDSDDAGMRAHEGFNFLGQLVVTACGAVLLAANVAPTEEIMQLGVEATPGKLILLLLLGMFISTIIIGFTEFKGSWQISALRRPYSILSGVLSTFVIGFTVAIAFLWYFGRLDGVALPLVLGQAIVLALPATVGGAAGRLLLHA